MTMLSEEFLKSAICNMTYAVRTNQGYEVHIPQVYSSGNVVSVIVSAVPNGFIIHDNSNAAMILERSGATKLQSLIKDASKGIEYYDCSIDSGRVSRTVENLDEVAMSMLLVGCASRLIADLALKVKPAPIFDFKSKLLGRVIEVVGSDRVRQNENVYGKHGSRYKIAALVLDHDRTKPIGFVEPIPDSSSVARKFKEFYDIKGNADYDSVDFVAVTDEQSNISASDALLMQDVSNLVRFQDSATRFKDWNTIR